MIRREKTPVVTIRNAYKRYSPKAVILAGLNMTIRKGTIYGLLGPSGCGKTTMLSCIVGRQTFDSGQIYVEFSRKRQVGYMPQDINLSGDLSIMEALVFYGRIYLMEIDEIYSKANDLISFLELPPKNRIVKNCSGGQQRRISMAVTLIHDPDFLILDEPTVGLDPVLCEKIMKFLVHLVEERDKTIVITTHYIEEARNSNTIGLMRGGILLAEESPQELMKRFNCEHLEDVFLILSAKQDSDNDKNLLPYPPINKPSTPFESKEIFNYKRFKTQLDKNLTWTKRNWAITLFVCFVPTLTMYLCCVNDIKSMVTSPIGTVIPEDLLCSSNFTKIRPCLPENVDFACRYVQILDKSYPVIVYQSIDTAYIDAKKGSLTGVVEIKRNFTQNIMTRLEKQTDAPDDVIDQSTLQVTLDMTIPLHALLVVERVYDSLQKLLEEVCLACNIDTRLTRIPIDYQEPVFGYEGMKYITTFLPAILCPFVFYITFVYTSTALMTEKESGLLERNQIAGLTLSEILLAQIIVQMVVLTLQNFCIFSVVYVYFDSDLIGKFSHIYFLVFLCEMFGMAYGIFLAFSMNKEIMVTYSGIGTMLTTFMLCGCLWPIEGQHWIVSSMGKLLPITYSVKGYFDVSLRGRGLDEVLLSIFMPLSGTLFITILIILFFRLKLIDV